MRLLIISLVICLMAMAGSVAADPCDGAYQYWYNVSTTDTTLYQFLVNDTAGVDLGDGVQYIWCNGTTTHFCYNDSSIYACYRDTTRLPLNVDVGNGSNYGTWEDELVLWLHMDDCSGTDCPDQSNYDQTCTKSAADNPANTSTGCIIGDCQDFTGLRNEGIVITDDDTIDFDTGIGFTAIFWLHPGESTESYEAFFHKAGSHYETIINSNQGLGFVYWNESNYRIVSNSNNGHFSYGNHYLIVATYDPATGTVYAYSNGSADIITTRTPGANARNQAGNLNLGHYTPGTTAFKDEIDEVRLYNRTWSQSESSAYFNNTCGCSVYSTLTGPYVAPVVTNYTITLEVSPTTLYNTTDAAFSIFYNESSSLSANITVNVSLNGVNISYPELVEYTKVAANTTLYYTAEAENWTKHDNITIYVNITTYGNLEPGNSTLSREIQNSVPNTPTITLDPHSVIIGDTWNGSGSTTDGDDDTLTYYYVFGYNNGTNLTNWTDGNLRISVNASNENDTFRLYVLADDGESNSTLNHTDINVTRLVIVWPSDNSTIYGTGLNFTFNITTNHFQPCTEYVNTTSYDLGNMTTGQWNNTRTVWYGEYVYNLTCTSLLDSSIVYYKNVTFHNTYATWNISIYTENDWDVPLNITGANLSIIITCEGGASYVYNFTGTIVTDVEPDCDVSTVSALVTYPTDSYLRERVPPCSGECEVRMYMADALVYTILQTPIYMSDYAYYDSLLELYKVSGENHYTIAQGYFDVEHKYVTYLMKDNSYLIRITNGDEIRDIGYLYAASATAQYLSLSQIAMRPSITLISDNLRMTAAFTNKSAPTSTLRIRYEDLLNLTENIRVRAFQGTNNTAFFDQTYTGTSNLTISLNNINTSFRYSVRFSVNHTVLGNSPVDFTVGVAAGTAPAWDMGLDESLYWIYSAFAFFIIMMTAWVIPPEGRMPGYILLIAETAALGIVQWFAFSSAQIALFVVFLVAGLLYEIRHRGIT